MGVGCEAQCGRLERLGLGSSHQESLAHRVGVQGPGPASWPGLFLAQSSLAEAAVTEQCASASVSVWKGYYYLQPVSLRIPWPCGDQPHRSI